MAQLDDKVVLVAGGARGIGAATARHAASSGARVVVGDVREAEGRALVEELGDVAAFVPLDVTDDAAWEAAVAHAESIGGGLDALVCSAGGTAVPVPMLDLRPDEYRDAVEVNQIGTFLGVQAGARSMARRGAGGSIVLVGSVLGRYALPGTMRQATSKAAVSSMARVAALELVSTAVRVNCVVPGAIDTPLLHTEGDWRGADARPTFGAMVPLGRVGTADEVAELICWLASDASTYCTGADFVVDGGVLAGRLPPVAD